MKNNQFPGEKYIGTNIRNPQGTHLPCILAIDNSDSTNENDDISKINEAIQLFIQQLRENALENNTIDLAAISFNSTVEVLSDFVPASEIQIPKLTAQGLTAMGEAIVKSIQLVKEQVKKYRELGIDSFIPIVVLITDGLPTDDITTAMELLKQESQKGAYGHVKLWIVATEGADIALCKKLTKRVLFLKDKNYKSIFNWLNESFVLISNSIVDETPKLPQLPDNVQVIPDDWM